MSASACLFSVYLHVHPRFSSSSFCHLLSHTSVHLPVVILYLSRTLVCLFEEFSHPSCILSPSPYFSHIPSFISFTFLPSYLLSFPFNYLLIIPSSFPSFHSSCYLALEILSHILPPPTTHFSFLLTEISGWQMINIWPNHVGKFNAFSVISPQSSNICKFFPELRKSSVT